jgi:hypothetical protein
MKNEEERARTFSDKQLKLARKGANVIKNNLKKSGIELNDEQFKMINGVIEILIGVAMFNLVLSK